MPSTRSILLNPYNPINQVHIYIPSEVNRTSSKKIIEFPNNINLHQILLIISKLEAKSFPNLFIFIIQIASNTNNLLLQTLKEFVANFDKSRDLFLQLTSNNENIKYYIKEKCSKDFVEVNLIFDIIPDGFNNISTFLHLFLNENIKDEEDLILGDLLNAENSPIIVKLLRLLNLGDDFFYQLILRCAELNSVDTFMAAIDVNKYLQESTGNFDENYNICAILKKAIEFTNCEIVKFLVKMFKHNFDKYEISEKLDISTYAFNANQLDILCDLLEFLDFPFPEKIIIETPDMRLNKIIANRNQFHQDILNEDNENIRKFIKIYPQTRFAYDWQNKSAVDKALSFQKYTSLFLLKSLGLDFDYDSSLNLNSFISLRRNKNVAKSVPNLTNSALLLFTKSFIYNRNDNLCDELLNEYYQMIMEWIGDIYSTEFGSKVIDVASQAINFKIIFDFECKSVQRISPDQNSYSLGLASHLHEWILIGAQHSGEDDRLRQQEIKGILAHEMCHFVMKTVYQNRMKSYYKNDNENLSIFNNIYDEIIQNIFDDEQRLLIEKGDGGNVPYVDDLCDGIISTVFICYTPNNHHLELIVRPVQLQAHYDDQPEHLDQLSNFYDNLFGFFRHQVMPALQTFSLKQREDVDDLNDCAGLLNQLNKSSLTISDVIEDNEFSQLCVVLTNVPKLFLLNIQKHVKQQKGGFLNAKNIFMSSDKMDDQYFYKKFKSILTAYNDLQVVIDCSKENLRHYKFINLNIGHKFVFVTKNNEICENIRKNLTRKNFKSTKIEKNYKWKELEKTTKDILLNEKVNFQNNFNYSLGELVDYKNVTKDLEDLIDDQLLNKLTDGSKIEINNVFTEKDENDNFDILFKPRKLIRFKVQKPINESDAEPTSSNTSQQLTNTIGFLQHNILEDTRVSRYVIVSDIAGSGKSWVVKHITAEIRRENPKKWVTYVDLKKFIDQFKCQKTVDNFVNFMTEKILKLKDNFDKNFFKILYKNGRIVILFDGFDEIAPDCAKFVKNLATSLEFNEGNQLWIATRDYFAVELLDELHTNTIYKLDEFADGWGVELIVNQWIIDMLPHIGQLPKESALEEIKKNPEYETYKENAENICKTVLKSQYLTIGMPQFYRIIGELTKVEKTILPNDTLLKLFENYMKKMYESWSHNKGTIRKDKCITNANEEVNYHTFHKLVAMEGIFGMDKNFCDFPPKTTNWSPEEIAAFDLLQRINDKYLFIHETFREYYAVSFIIEVLRLPTFKTSVCEFLIPFLTESKHKIIRMFLNEAFLLNKTKWTDNKTKEISSSFCEDSTKLVNLSYMFGEGYDKLANFVVDIFEKLEDSEKLKTILIQNGDLMKSAANNTKTFTKCLDLITEKLGKSDLEEYLKLNGSFLSIFLINWNFEETLKCMRQIEMKLSEEFINSALQLTDKSEENILFYLISSKHANEDKFIKIFNLLISKLGTDVVLALTIQLNKDGCNVLHTCCANGDANKLKYIWTTLEQFLKSQDYLDKFENFFEQKSSNESQTVLHVAAKCKNLEFHKTLWEHLLSKFEPSKIEELMSFKEYEDNNYPSHLVFHGSGEIVEWTFTKLEEILSAENYSKMMKTKGHKNRNLLQRAIYGSDDGKIIKFLYNSFKNLYKTDEQLLELLLEEDRDRNNSIHLSSFRSTVSNFNFLIEKLKELTNNNDQKIRNIFTLRDNRSHQLMHCAAAQMNYEECHTNLWNYMKQYFSYFEIFDIIIHEDTFENDVFFITMERNNLSIILMLWRHIQELIKEICGESDQLSELIRQVSDSVDNCIENIASKDRQELFKKKWQELVKFILSTGSYNYLQLEVNQPAIGDYSAFLKKLATCDDQELFEKSWNYFCKSLKGGNDELKCLILQKDWTTKNFIYSLIQNGNLGTTKFTFEDFNSRFGVDKENLKEILKTKGPTGCNLLQQAVSKPGNFEYFKYLWKVFNEIFSDDQEFLNFIKEENDSDRSILFIAASSVNVEIFKYIINNLKIKYPNKVFNETLKHYNEVQGNLLHSATLNNKSLLFHQEIWKTIEENLNTEEINELMTQCDGDNDNIMHNVVHWNKLEVVRLTWEKIKNYLKESQISYLMRKGHDLMTLEDIARPNRTNDADTHAWVLELIEKVSDEATEVNGKVA